MKRLWLAGLCSLCLHAAAALGIWRIAGAPSDALRALLVELLPPVIERLAPLLPAPAASALAPAAARPEPLPPATVTPPPVAVASPPLAPEAPSPLPRPAAEPAPPQRRTAGALPLDAVFEGRPAVQAPVAAQADRPAVHAGPTVSTPGADRKPAGGGVEPVAVPALPGPEALLTTAVPPPAAGPVLEDAGYLRLFRSRVEGALIYPLSARRRGLAGVVELEVRLRFDGSVEQIRVLRSSGHALLDQAAVRGVETAAPFSLPEARPRQPLTVLLPVAFELR